MHPRVEARTLKTPRLLSKTFKNLDQWNNLLLTAFALDDQEAEGEYDPVHAEVREICDGLSDAVDNIRRWHGTLVRLNNSQPIAGERVSEIVNCLACGEPALPRPYSGFCPDVCYQRFLEFRHDGNGDRTDFIKFRKQEILDALIADQESDK